MSEHTQQLLDDEDFTEAVSSVRVESRSFKDESTSRKIDYNRIVIEFHTGEQLELKLDKADKVNLYWLLKTQASVK